MTVKAFDTETELTTAVRPIPPLVCLSYSDGTREGSGLVNRWDSAELFASWLESHITLVAHNGYYDLLVLAKAHPELRPLIDRGLREGQFSDTGTRQQLIDNGKGTYLHDVAGRQVRFYSLAQLVRLYLGRDISASKEADSWRYRYVELINVPVTDWPEDASKYAIDDSKYAWLVHKHQQKRHGKWLRAEQFIVRSELELQEIGHNGLLVAKARAHELVERNQLKLERLTPILVSMGMVSRGGTKAAPKWCKKDKVARELMRTTIIARGLDPDEAPFRTKSGATAIGREACVLLKAHRPVDAVYPPNEDPDERLMLRAEFAGAQKLISTYAKPMLAALEHDGVIRTSFGMAATMRTTSKSPKDPVIGTNLQNAPREGGVRECFIPREGYVYLSGDFSGAELLCLAQACLRTVGHSRLGDIIRAGKDAHLALAAEQLLKIDYDLAVQLKDAEDPQVDKARQGSKAANFGYGGRMGAKKWRLVQLRNGKIYSLEEAEMLREAWLRQHPEMDDYFDYCKRLLNIHDVATIELWPGGPWRTCQGLSTVCNGFFQGPAAGGGRAAVSAVSMACRQDTPLRGALPVNWVHDELILELPEASTSSMHESAMYFAALMVGAFQEFVPDFTPKVDPVLSRVWTKGAKPVYDDQKRLTLWQPKEAA